MKNAIRLGLSILLVGSLSPALLAKGELSDDAPLAPVRAESSLVGGASATQTDDPRGEFYWERYWDPVTQTWKYRWVPD